MTDNDEDLFSPGTLLLGVGICLIELMSDKYKFNYDADVLINGLIAYIDSSSNILMHFGLVN